MLLSDFRCFCGPTNLTTTCLTLSRCKLSVACLVAGDTCIVLKPIPQPHCSAFTLKNEIKFILFWSKQVPACNLFVFELNNMQNVILLYVLPNIFFHWMNNWMNCMQSVASIMGKAPVSKNVGFWWSKVDFTLVAWLQRRGVRIPGNCPVAQTTCTLKDQMAILEDSEGWSAAATLWR